MSADRPPSAAPPISLDALPFYNNATLRSCDGTYPVACIHPDRVVIYTAQDRPRQRSAAQLATETNLRGPTYTGYLSPGTAGKLRGILGTWLQSIHIYRSEIKHPYAPGRAYAVFATLSLPGKQLHDDKAINRECLQPFIQRLKREHGIEHYFWRAEAQERGAIHYHFILDRYIDHRSLQMLWNLSLNKLGYLDRYFSETGSLYPPSCDILAVKDYIIDKKTGERRPACPVSYILKYALKIPKLKPLIESVDEDGVITRFEKEEQASELINSNGLKCRPISGRVWGMSNGLRACKPARAEADLHLINALQAACEAGNAHRFDMEHVVIYFFRGGRKASSVLRWLWPFLRSYYLNVFAELYPALLPRGSLSQRFSGPAGHQWLDLSTFQFYVPLTWAEIQERDNPGHVFTKSLEAFVKPEPAPVPDLFNSAA